MEFWCHFFKTFLEFWKSGGLVLFCYKFYNFCSKLLRQKRLYSGSDSDDRYEIYHFSIPTPASERNGYVLVQWSWIQCLDFCHCAYHTCSTSFKMCWFTGNQRSDGWFGVRLVCVPVCRQPLCFSLSFLFLHWGESASSESPSSFLTYTSPSALVLIIEMIVNYFETTDFSNHLFLKNMMSK